MKPEQAMHFEIMLATDVTDSFELWLDNALNEEDPLSDDVLELSAADVDKIDYLHGLSADKQLDQNEVFDLVWKDLGEHYFDGRLSASECIDIIYAGAEMTGGIYEKPWSAAQDLSCYNDMVDDGLVEKESFENAFGVFMRDKTPVTDDSLTAIEQPELKWWQKLKYFLLLRRK